MKKALFLLFDIPPTDPLPPCRAYLVFCDRKGDVDRRLDLVLPQAMNLHHAIHDALDLLIINRLPRSQKFALVYPRYDRLTAAMITEAVESVEKQIGAPLELLDDLPADAQQDAIMETLAQLVKAEADKHGFGFLRDIPKRRADLDAAHKLAKHGQAAMSGQAGQALQRKTSRGVFSLANLHRFRVQFFGDEKYLYPLKPMRRSDPCDQFRYLEVSRLDPGERQIAEAELLAHLANRLANNLDNGPDLVLIIAGLRYLKSHAAIPLLVQLLTSAKYRPCAELAILKIKE
jgi:hypothetical protein